MVAIGLFAEPGTGSRSQSSEGIPILEAGLFAFHRVAATDSQYTNSVAAVRMGAGKILDLERDRWALGLWLVY